MKQFLRCCFALLVVSLGVTLYFTLPDAPLWSVVADEEIGGFTPDGAHFFTYAATHEHHGPIRLRESRTGSLVETFFPEGPTLHRPEVSSDRRYWAAIVEPNEVRVIDFQERRAWSLPAKDVSGEYQVQFSPTSDMLQIRAAHAKLPNRNFLFELPSGKLIGDPDEILYVHYSQDGRHLAYVTKAGLHLWDRKAQKEITCDWDGDERIRFSFDGRRLVTYHDRDEKEPFQLALWDLENYRRIALLPVEQPLETRYAVTTFARDDRWFKTWHDYPDDGRVLATWDSETGKRIARYELGPRRRSFVSAPDSSCVLVDEWGRKRGDEEDDENSPVSLTLLEMPSAKVRWRRELAHRPPTVLWMMGGGIRRGDPDHFRFSPDGQVVVAFSTLHAEWEYLDVRTGATLKTVRLLEDGASALAPGRPEISPDGRWIHTTYRQSDPPESKWLAWIRRWVPKKQNHSTLTMVHDLASGDELLRMRIVGNADGTLAPDGQLLLTCTWLPDGSAPSRCLQAWPVPAHRPWAMIVGVPVLFAGALLSVRWIWRRLRPSKSASAVSTAPNERY